MVTLFGPPSSMLGHGFRRLIGILLSAVAVYHADTATVLRLLSYGYNLLASSFRAVALLQN